MQIQSFKQAIWKPYNLNTVILRAQQRCICWEAHEWSIWAVVISLRLPKIEGKVAAHISYCTYCKGYVRCKSLTFSMCYMCPVSKNPPMANNDTDSFVSDQCLTDTENQEAKWCLENMGESRIWCKTWFQKGNILMSIFLWIWFFLPFDLI